MGKLPAGQLVNGLIVSEPERVPPRPQALLTTLRVPPMTDDSFYRVPVDGKWSRTRGLMWDNSYDSGDEVVEVGRRVTCDGRCLDERRAGSACRRRRPRPLAQTWQAQGVKGTMS